MKFPHYITTAFFVLMAFASSNSQATDIFGNYPGNDGTVTSLSAGRAKALSFTMNSSSSLGSMVLRLRDIDPLAVINVQMMNDTGGIDPGTTVLANFTTPAFQGSGIFDYNFNPTTPFTLQSGTTYWLQVAYVSGTELGNTGWTASSPSLTPTGPLATYNGQRFSTNSGASWTSSSIINTFKLDSTILPVPEPSTYALGAIATGVLGFMTRRRRRLHV